jgi:CDP-diacylglycerol---glycerol-3-phosphate 3-phosphatidyltransferase
MKDVEKRIWTAANIVSLARIGAFPIILILAYIEYYCTSEAGKRTISLITFLLFSVAFLTDYLDGYLARSRGEVTKLGKLLDPLSDKALVVTVLVILVMFDRAPAWVAVLIILREIAVTGLRTMALAEGVLVSSSMWGKVKTNAQAFALGSLILHYNRNILGLNVNAHLLGTVLLYVALAITLYSGYDYFDKVLRSALGSGKTGEENDDPLESG